jgi:hypothetical protein
VSSESTLIATYYNRLSTVNVADQDLKRHERDAALEALCSVITSHGLEQYLGIRLLHKHNDIEDGEIMVEDAEFDELAGFTLITQPKPLATQDHSWVANSWRFVNQCYVPSEFSHSRLLEGPTVSPTTEKKCFDQLAVALCDLRLEAILGPSLNVGSAVESQRPAGQTILSEITDEENRRNIVRFVNLSEVDESRVIETSWFAGIHCGNEHRDVPPEPLPDEGRSSRRHFLSQLAALSASLTVAAPAATFHSANPKAAGVCKKICTRICPSVQDGTKHQGTFQHNSDHKYQE